MGRFDSGRGGRCGRGRGRSSSSSSGRGQGRYNRYISNRSTSSSVKTEYIFQPLGRGKQNVPGTFETIKEYIVSQIQMTFKNGHDIADCIRKEKWAALPKPVRQESQETDASMKTFEQETFDMKYQAQLITHSKRIQVMEQNGPKAYAFILREHCSKTMRNRVEAHPTFVSTVQDDPIELLKLIRVLMHDPATAKYPFSTLTDTIERFLSTKQQSDEPLLDYVKRFKQQRDVMKTVLGTDFLNHFVTQTHEYQNETDQTKKAQMLHEAFERWYEFLLLKNSDQDKYGSLLNGLASQYSLSNPQVSESHS